MSLPDDSRRQGVPVTEVIRRGRYTGRVYTVQSVRVFSSICYVVGWNSKGIGLEGYSPSETWSSVVYL